MGVGVYFTLVMVSITCGFLFAWYEKMRFNHKGWTYHLVQWAMLTIWYWTAWVVGRIVYLEDTIFSKFGVSAGIFIVCGVAYVGFRKLLSVGEKLQAGENLELWKLAPIWANYLLIDIDGKFRFYREKPEQIGSISGDAIGYYYIYADPLGPSITGKILERPKGTGQRDGKKQ